MGRTLENAGSTGQLCSGAPVSGGGTAMNVLWPPQHSKEFLRPPQTQPPLVPGRPCLWLACLFYFLILLV